MRQRDFLQKHAVTGQGGVGLDIRKKFCSERLVRHWIRLSREAMDVPSLEVFKTRLHGVLRNLVQCKMLSMAEGLKQDDPFKGSLDGPFKARIFSDSVIQFLQFS